MAKRATHKDDGDAPEEGGLNVPEFQRVIAEANRQKGLAAEYSGSHGKVVRDAIERLSLRRGPFATTCKYSRMDAAKRTDEILTSLNYFVAAGFFDQMDMHFDAVAQVQEKLDMLQAALDAIKLKQPERQPSAIMERIVN